MIKFIPSKPASQTNTFYTVLTQGEARRLAALREQAIEDARITDADRTPA